MEITRVIHKKIAGKEYFDSKILDKVRTIEDLKSRNMVYKCTYELVTGHLPTKVSTSNYKNPGPNYRLQGATMNGQKL